jgi:uncharacterized Zn finger protein
MAYGWSEWRPYVPVAVRRQSAAREIARFRRKGPPLAPVTIQGRAIARSFWGKAWCDNLEAYSDFANRLPRGRTYVRNGSVMDLQVGIGTVSALVSGSELYEVSVSVKPLPRPRWLAVIKACAGKIDSLVELLQGRFSRGVMEVLIRPQTGLFPSPREISFECSCPDWAAMCKHVAATLYGVGARLDQSPDLFFRLRRVDQAELLTEAGSGAALTAGGNGRHERIAESALADVFGIELDAPTAASDAQALAPAMRNRAARPSGRASSRSTTTPTATRRRPHGERRQGQGRLDSRPAVRSAAAGRQPRRRRRGAAPRSRT